MAPQDPGGRGSDVVRPGGDERLHLWISRASLMGAEVGCWCGQTDLRPWNDDYLDCPSCATLVRRAMPAGDVTRVGDEDNDLYGRNYWFSHQRKLGNPTLEERSVSDLTARCAHWLAAILAHRIPPARVLELGASHGGFVALLEEAGFDATGLEISPWVAAFAREAFGVTMLEGPIEDHDLQPKSFDIVCAFDVLEHLPDPVTTIGRCCGLLPEDGILFLQTPCRPEGLSPRDLGRDDHPFARMLIPEHLFLFSRRAVNELLGRFGFEYLVSVPPVFETDLLTVAGRRPLTEIGDAVVEDTLRRKERGRLILALIEAARSHRRLERLYLRADADRIGRQDQIEELQRTIERTRRDVTSERRLLGEEKKALEIRIDELIGEQLRAADARQTDRRTIARLEDEADRFRKTAESLEQTVRKRDGELETKRRQVQEKQQRIDALEDAAGALRRDVDAAARAAAEAQRRVGVLSEELERAEAAVESTRSDLREAEAESTRLAAELEERERTLASYVLAVADHNEHAARLSARLGTIRGLIDNYRRSRLYRLMVRSGRWRRFDELMERALSGRRSPLHTVRHADEGGAETWVIPNVHPIGDRTRNPTVAVDLTSLIPGGENGGAKLVATELVRSMAELAPEWDFLLLTNPACHLELAYLDRPTIRRRRSDVGPCELYEILDEEPVALLFSPMTAPQFHDPRVPVVSVVHDLQIYTYPEFFTDEDFAERDRAFRNAVARSDRIVTVSDYVRSTVLEHSGASPGRVVTIHNGLANRLAATRPEEVDEVLDRYGLESDRYLLYPANFWSHKNHRMLLTAFSLHAREHPADGLRLVLTGADRPDGGPIRDAARQMGLDGRVVIPGFVPDSDLASLVSGCRALVFPSLYEGFGIPVTEAMAVGRPVICSRSTSLPEVAGDAALMIDPRKPVELAAAITRVCSDDELVGDLVDRGLRRARAIGGRQRMARAYLDVFESVLAGPRRHTNSLAGVFPDRWCGGGFVVGYDGNATELRLGLANHREDAVALSATAGSFSRHVVLGPHRSLELTCRLPDGPGCLEFAVSSTFCPAERGPSPDTRRLGLWLAACHLTGDTEADLLAGFGGG